MSQSTPLREFVRYSALSSCGMIAVSCYILADTFFVAQGLGTAGLAALNLAIPIYNFIHGTGLMLGMGVFGAVLATGMSPVLGILILLPHCIRKKGDLRLVPGPLSPGPTASALSLGLPSLLAQLSSAVVMIAFNSIILGLEGNTGVAAYGVIANISLVVTAVYTGISQGIQPLVSTAHGQDRPGLIRQYLRYALITLLVLSAALYLLLFLFAGPVALIFNSEGDPRLQQIAEEGLRLYFTGALFAGFNIILSMYFTSVERALPAHITSLLRGFLLILPMAFLLAACWGMTGVWLAFPLTEAVTAALGAGFYALYARRGRARS